MANMSTPTISVFIIEDQPDLNRLYQKVLRNAGFATTGYEDLETVRAHLQHGPLPHIIITDLALKDGNGAELLAMLNEPRYDNIKVVVVSGHTYDQEQIHINRADFALLKPVSPRGLKTLVQSIRDELLTSVA